MRYNRRRICLDRETQLASDVTNSILTAEEKEKYDNLPPLTDKFGIPLREGMSWYKGGFRH